MFRTAVGGSAYPRDEASPPAWVRQRLRWDVGQPPASRAAVEELAMGPEADAMRDRGAPAAQSSTQRFTRLKYTAGRTWLSAQQKWRSPEELWPEPARWEHTVKPEDLWPEPPRWEAAALPAKPRKSLDMAAAVQSSAGSITNAEPDQTRKQGVSNSDVSTKARAGPIPMEAELSTESIAATGEAVCARYRAPPVMERGLSRRSKSLAKQALAADVEPVIRADTGSSVTEVARVPSPDIAGLDFSDPEKQGAAAQGIDVADTNAWSDEDGLISDDSALVGSCPVARWRGDSATSSATANRPHPSSHPDLSMSPQISSAAPPSIAAAAGAAFGTGAQMAAVAAGSACEGDAALPQLAWLRTDGSVRGDGSIALESKMLPQRTEGGPVVVVPGLAAALSHCGDGRGAIGSRLHAAGRVGSGSPCDRVFVETEAKLPHSKNESHLWDLESAKVRMQVERVQDFGDKAHGSTDAPLFAQTVSCAHVVPQLEIAEVAQDLSMSTNTATPDQSVKNLFGSECVPTEDGGPPCAAGLIAPCASRLNGKSADLVLSQGTPLPHVVACCAPTQGMDDSGDLEAAERAAQEAHIKRLEAQVECLSRELESARAEQVQQWQRFVRAEEQIARLSEDKQELVADKRRLQVLVTELAASSTFCSGEILDGATKALEPFPAKGVSMGHGMERPPPAPAAQERCTHGGGKSATLENAPEVLSPIDSPQSLAALAQQHAAARGGSSCEEHEMQSVRSQPSSRASSKSKVQLMAAISECAVVNRARKAQEMASASEKKQVALRRRNSIEKASAESRRRARVRAEVDRSERTSRASSVDSSVSSASALDRTASSSGVFTTPDSPAGRKRASSVGTEHRPVKSGDGTAQPSGVSVSRSLPHLFGIGDDAKTSIPEGTRKIAAKPRLASAREEAAAAQARLETILAAAQDGLEGSEDGISGGDGGSRASNKQTKLSHTDDHAQGSCGPCPLQYTGPLGLARALAALRSP